MFETDRWAVWIFRLVGLLVVQPVNTHPIYRRAHHAEVAARNKRVHHPFGNLERLVREQSMVSQGDSEPEIREEKEEPGCETTDGHPERLI